MFARLPVNGHQRKSMGYVTVAPQKWLLKNQIDTFTSQDWHFRFTSPTTRIASVA
jgi:hypothetical protein